MKPRRRFSFEDLGFLATFLAVTVFCLGIGILTYLPARESMRSAREFYHPGDILQLQGYRDFDLEFEILEVSIPGVLPLIDYQATVSLSGVLWVEKPEGASYVSAAPGSLTVNWNYPDGSGWTWYLEGLELASPRPNEDRQFEISEIRVAP